MANDRNKIVVFALIAAVIVVAVLFTSNPKPTNLSETDLGNFGLACTSAGGNVLRPDVLAMDYKCVCNVGPDAGSISEWKAGKKLECALPIAKVLTVGMSGVGY